MAEKQDGPHPTALLLDWHLDRLDAEERRWMDEQMRNDASLRAMSGQLSRFLQPLDYWSVAPPAQNLPDKVLAYVGRRSSLSDPTADPSSLEREPQGDAKPVRSVLSGARGWVLPFGRIRDLIAAAACVVVLVGLSLLGVSELRAHSRRVFCSRNLASIFQGAALYQQASGGYLPYAGRLASTAWLPGAAATRPYASNSRHVYRLLKLGFVNSAGVFVCPGRESPGSAEVVDDWSAHEDFPSAKNITVATLNLSGPQPSVRPAMPIAYAGDTNPLFVNAKFDASVDPYETNSPAHRGRGQNVLTLDGNVKWIEKPEYGPKRDNLWLIGNIRHYTGTETPDGQDVQLVPGFPATDPQVHRVLAR